MNILVTGGAGYVGSVCCAELAKRGHHVVVYDDLSAGHRAAVSPESAWVKGDIADTVKVARTCRRFKIQAAMHFAAKALVDESMRDPRSFYRSNVAGGIAFLEALLEAGVKNLVFSSSAATYGEPIQVPITEEHPTQPVNTYGETKLVLERALASYHRAYGLNCIALRYFNAAGAAGHLGEDHRPETHLMPCLLDAMLSADKSFSIYGEDYATPDGTCVRDFVHVLDIAQAHLLALEAVPKKGFAIYNIGLGKGYSVSEVIEAAKKVTGRTPRVVSASRRQGDPAILVASPEKIRRELGWNPRASDLESILQSAWAWRQRFPNGYPASRRQASDSIEPRRGGVPRPVSGTRSRLSNEDQASRGGQTRPRKHAGQMA